MLTITDFINILHRYYRSPLVSSAGRTWGSGQAWGREGLSPPLPVPSSLSWSALHHYTMTRGCSGPAQYLLAAPLPGTKNMILAPRGMGCDASGRGQSARGATMTRASPCPQVQIYEVEEHKIETWRGKKQGVMGVAELGMLCSMWRWVLGLHEGDRGPSLSPLSLGRCLPAGLPQATGLHLPKQ